MDPLSVLRQFAVERRLDSVRVEGGRVAFGDQYSFPARALTRFKGAGGQLLTLESAVLFIQNIGLGAAAYVKACQDAGGVPVVPVTDRKPLRDFLGGSNEASALARLVDAAEVPVAAEDAEAMGAAAGAAGGAAAGAGAGAALASAVPSSAAPAAVAPSAATTVAASAAAAITPEAEDQAALRLLDATATAAAGERAAKRARVEDASAAAAGPTSAAAAAAATTTDPTTARALRLLAAQERQLRDRNTMLLVPNRVFTRVLQVAEQADARQRQRQAVEEAERAQQQRQRLQQQQQQQQRARASGGQQGQRQGGAYQQQQQDPGAFIKASGRFERERDAAAGTVQAMAGAVGGAGGAGGAADAGLLAAADVGLGYGAEEGGAGAAGAAAAAAAAYQAARARAAAAAARPSARAPAPAAAPRSSSSSAGVVPLIIVPAAMSAMLNMWNARAFFEEGKFVPSAEAYKRDPAKKPVLAFRRSALRSPPNLPAYQVTDSVPAKGSPDWQRVVAVIVQGKPWQFRDWPFKGAAQGGETSWTRRALPASGCFSFSSAPDAAALHPKKKIQLLTTPPLPLPPPSLPPTQQQQNRPRRRLLARARRLPSLCR
jgi:hypothetical protein